MEDTRTTFRFKNDILHSVLYEFKNHNNKWEVYKTKKWNGKGYTIKDLREKAKPKRDGSLYYSEDAKEVLGVDN